MGFSTRKEKILNSISPLSLVAIVALNILLIYMNLISLENQNTILSEIKVNTEIGLNVSNQNHELLERISDVQNVSSHILRNLNISSSGSLP